MEGKIIHDPINLNGLDHLTPTEYRPYRLVLLPDGGGNDDPRSFVIAMKGETAPAVCRIPFQTLQSALGDMGFHIAPGIFDPKETPAHNHVTALRTFAAMNGHPMILFLAETEEPGGGHFAGYGAADKIRAMLVRAIESKPAAAFFDLLRKILFGT